MEELKEMEERFNNEVTLQPRWHHPIGLAMIDQNPLIVGDTVITIVGAEIICSDLIAGHERWRYQLPGESLRGQRAVIDGENLYTTTSGSINQLTHEPPHDSLAVCLRLRDGALRWLVELQATARQYSITVGSTGYGPTPGKIVWIGAHKAPRMSSVLLGLDATTGQIIARRPLPDEHRVEALTVLNDGRLLIGTMTCLLRWDPRLVDEPMVMLMETEVYTLERHILRITTAEARPPASDFSVITAMIDDLAGYRHIALLNATDGRPYWWAHMVSGMAGVHLSFSAEAAISASPSDSTLNSERSDPLLPFPPGLDGAICVAQKVAEEPLGQGPGLLVCLELRTGLPRWIIRHGLDVRTGMVRCDDRYVYIRGLRQDRSWVAIYDLRDGTLIRRWTSKIAQRFGLISWLSVTPAVPDEEGQITPSISLEGQLTGEHWLVTSDLDFVEGYTLEDILSAPLSEISEPISESL